MSSFVIGKKPIGKNRARSPARSVEDRIGNVKDNSVPSLVTRDRKGGQAGGFDADEAGSMRASKKTLIRASTEVLPRIGGSTLLIPSYSHLNSL